MPDLSHEIPEGPNNKISRRKFLKAISAGAIVAATANYNIPKAKAEPFLKQQNELIISQEIDTYLKDKLGGKYEVVPRENLITELVTKGLICIGDVHIVPEDMPYIQELINEISTKTNRPILVAFERFSYELDSERLDIVNSANDTQKEKSLTDLFENSPFYLRWKNTFASETAFEELVRNCANKGFKLSGLDVVMPEVGAVAREVRNAGWVDNLLLALDRHFPDNQQKPLVIAVGGAGHMSAEADSFVSFAAKDKRLQQLGGPVSVQLPYAVEQYSLAKEQRDLAAQTDEFIVKRLGPAELPANVPLMQGIKTIQVRDYWVVVNKSYFNS